MRAFLLALVLLAGLPLAPPVADACHPSFDPETRVWVWVDHGCGGGGAYACVRALVADECRSLLP